MIRKASSAEMEPNKRGAPKRWPLHKMRVGDVLVCKQGEYGKARVSAYPHTFAQLRGWQFKIRYKGDGFYNVIRLK